MADVVYMEHVRYVPETYVPSESLHTLLMTSNMMEGIADLTRIRKMSIARVKALEPWRCFLIIQVPRFGGHNTFSPLTNNRNKRFECSSIVVFRQLSQPYSQRRLQREIAELLEPHRDEVRFQSAPRCPLHFPLLLSMILLSKV